MRTRTGAGEPAGYSSSHCSTAHGVRYDRDLARGYQGHLWRARERGLLGGVLRELVRRGPAASVLDLACGTGRILEVEASYATDLSGLDISAPMLEVCAARVPEAALTLAPIDAFAPGRTFDVISAFRFFTNAEPSLRRDALAAVDRLLSPGGWFVSNVHLQVSSPGGVARWARGAGSRRGYPRAYWWRAHRRLLEDHGFRVERLVPYGLLPNVGRLARPAYMELNGRAEASGKFRSLPSVHDSVLFVATKR
jgi:SAM-dependent methyltransferase